MSSLHKDLTGRLIGDGITDNHAVLQAALDGGNVVITLPPGRFLVSRTLKVSSHTRINATAKTVIKLAPHTGKHFDDWLLTNADHVGGNCGIAITGGIWDINGKENPRGVRENLDDYGGVGLYFLRMKELTLKDLTIANADSFFSMLCETEDFLLENVKLFNDSPKINQDGVHVGGFSRNGVIRGLRAISPLTPGDDLVALNANDGTAHFTHGQLPGPIENIVIEDLYADSAYTFVRLLSQEQPIRNVVIKNARGGARNNFLNVNRWRFPAGGGNIRDIHISDVEVHKMPCSVPEPRIQPEPLCDINLKIDNLVIENFRRPMLDNGIGDTIRVDMGVPCRIAFEPESDGESLQNQGDASGRVTIGRLADGGFKRLAVTLC